MLYIYIIHSFHGKSVFTVMSQGFYQVPLDEASSFLCTFNTPFGRDQILRMPFGLSSAPKAFQRINSAVFCDIKGVHIIFYDMIVTSENADEHDRILGEVFKRSLKRFNIDKIHYRVSSV